MHNRRKIYFRADAGPDIGYGHYIRSLALADMLKNDFDCKMFTQSPTEYQLRESVGICDVIAMPSDDTRFSKFIEYLVGDEIVVLDNYFYTTDYQRAIKNKGCKLVCIDDIHDKHFVADVVINQTPTTIADLYSIEDYTKLCIGNAYAILRLAFITRDYVPNKDYSSILIAMGGSDKRDLTNLYAKLLLNNDKIKRINIIIGDQYGGEIIKNDKVVYFKNVPAEKLYDFFSKSGATILPASTMMKEALASGANIIGGYYVDNQKEDYQYYKMNNLIYPIGNMTNSATMSQISRLNFSPDMFDKINRITFTEVSKRFIDLFRNL